jgi:hypothetical protein
MKRLALHRDVRRRGISLTRSIQPGLVMPAMRERNRAGEEDRVALAARRVTPQNVSFISGRTRVRNYVNFGLVPLTSCQIFILSAFEKGR